MQPTANSSPGNRSVCFYLCVSVRGKERGRERNRVCVASLSGIRSRAMGASLKSCHYLISFQPFRGECEGEGRGGQHYLTVNIRCIILH